MYKPFPLIVEVFPSARCGRPVRFFQVISTGSSTGILAPERRKFMVIRGSLKANIIDTQRLAFFSVQIKMLSLIPSVLKRLYRRGVTRPVNPPTYSRAPGMAACRPHWTAPPCPLLLNWMNPTAPDLTVRPPLPLLMPGKPHLPKVPPVTGFSCHQGEAFFVEHILHGLHSPGKDTEVP